MIKHENNLKITSGTYNGDNALNRHIAHGLGRIPKWVEITRATNADLWVISDQTGTALNQIGTGQVTVDAMDATYFHVGDNPATGAGANFNPTPALKYNWVAYG